EPFYATLVEIGDQSIANTGGFEPSDFDYISGYVNPSTGAVVNNTAGNIVSKLIELRKGETLKVRVYSQQQTVSVLSKWLYDGTTPTFQRSLMVGNLDSPNIDINYTATEDVEYLRLGGVNDAQTKMDTIQIVKPAEGAASYNQSLNTTDSVQFDSVSADAFVTTGTMPTGTLTNPPTGLRAGDVWADTTDSTAHPVLRVMM